MPTTFQDVSIIIRNQIICEVLFMKQKLTELVFQKAFRYSEKPAFKLVSGSLSNYYFNCKTVTLHPEGMYLIGHVVFEMVKDMHIHGIGGLTLGADPIAFAVAFTSHTQGQPIEAFVVRKSAKSHGTMQWIEGNVNEGNRVVIVEDVITTGKSTVEAIKRAREAGLDIAAVIALVDRQEGGRELIASLGYTVQSVITRDEIMGLYRARHRENR